MSSGTLLIGTLLVIAFETYCMRLFGAAAMEQAAYRQVVASYDKAQREATRT